MSDREKVIKGLERCKLYNKLNCDKCPYDYNGRGNGKSECTAELATDALALLKEQDSVDIEIEGGVQSWWYVCEECRGPVDTSDHFCRHCGRPIRNRKCVGCKDECPTSGNFVCPNGKL